MLEFIICKLGFQAKFSQETCNQVTNYPVFCFTSIQLPENSTKFVEHEVLTQNYETEIVSILKHDDEQGYFSYFSIFSIDVSYLSLNIWLWTLTLLPVLGTYFLDNIDEHLYHTKSYFWKNFSYRYFLDIVCHPIRAISQDKFQNKLSKQTQYYHLRCVFDNTDQVFYQHTS